MEPRLDEAVRLPRRLHRYLLHLFLILPFTLASAVVANPLEVPIRLDAARRQAWRRGMVDSFLEERSLLSPLCLYTFDEVEEAQDNGIIEPRARIRGHLPDRCPFGDLLLDNELVSSLNSNASGYQLGIRISEDPGKDPLRVQAAATDIVSAREFFIRAATTVDPDASKNKPHTNGIAFELVVRNRVATNQSMTLVAITNEHDNCADAGFRLDVNEYQELVFTYRVPVLTADFEERCYTHRFVSAKEGHKSCTLPPVTDHEADPPPVYIMMTLDPSHSNDMWETNFFVSYQDPTTMQRVDCEIFDVLQLRNASDSVLWSTIEGSYRLFLGNHPRNSTSPKSRGTLAKTRVYRPVGGQDDNKNATERLRDLLRQKLMNIQGPRMPKAMRVFGDNAVSLHVLGVTFPPISEDTPFALMRNAIEEFKANYGDVAVDYLLRLLRNRVSNQSRLSSSFTSSDEFFAESAHDGAQEQIKTTKKTSEGATFDLFHFALYDRAITRDEFVQAVWKNQTRWLRMSPFRMFPAMNSSVHISEDELALIGLTQLHSVFDDVRLELLSVPSAGQLLLFPDKAPVFKNDAAAFVRLPLEYQQQVYFRPNSDDSSCACSKACLDPFDWYATLEFGVADSVSGRNVSSNARIGRVHIIVNARNDPPRPRTPLLEINVLMGEPVLFELDGRDIDGVPTQRGGDHDSTCEPMDDNEKSDAQPGQLTQILQFPLRGMLLDANRCRFEAPYEIDDSSMLEDCRVTENSSVFTSTHLAYVYRGWGGEYANHSRSFDDGPVVKSSSPTVLDSLMYRLSDGDTTVFSNPARVDFVAAVLINASSPLDSSQLNTIEIVNVSENSFAVIVIALLEPLTGLIDPRSRYRLTTLPRNGSLFQIGATNQDFNTSDIASGDSSTISRLLGDRISLTDTLVDDELGRVIYVPDRNYFNAELRTSKADFFEYNVVNIAQAVNSTPTSRSPTQFGGDRPVHLTDPLHPRAIRFRVVNEPDSLAIRPPYAWQTSAGYGEAVSTPLSFDDPDNGNDELYEASLKTERGDISLALAQPVTNDDVMAVCGFDRPCYLERQIEAVNHTTANSANAATVTYTIVGALFDQTHLQVSGTMVSLQAALVGLVLRDYSDFSSSRPHTVQFSLTISRINSSEQDAITEIFTVTFDGSSNRETSATISSELSHSFYEMTWTTIFFITFWVVISNVACCSGAFCCCCAQNRQKQRRRFEEERRMLQDQVAQNDFEYSKLAVELANVLLEPDLLTPIALVQSSQFGSSSSRRRMETILCLKSLFPVLESERQGTRLVFGLIQLDFERAKDDAMLKFDPFNEGAFLAYPSVAGMALSHFCRTVGGKWLQRVVAATFVSIQSRESSTDKLLDQLITHVTDIPAEIVILCRAVGILFESLLAHDDSKTKAQCLQLLGAHLVFFDHFVGPMLLFGCVNQGECAVSAITIHHAAECWRQSSRYMMAPTSPSPSASLSSIHESSLDRTTAHQYRSCSETVRERYHDLVRTITSSSKVPSSYEPRRASEVDNELVSLCLMNIHAYLDMYLAQAHDHYNILADHRARMSSNCSAASLHEIDALDTPKSIDCLEQVVKAMGFPLMSMRTLMEHSKREILSDTVLWHGWSLDEWSKRAHDLHRCVDNMSDAKASEVRRKCLRASSLDAVYVEKTAHAETTTNIPASTEDSVD